MLFRQREGLSRAENRDTDEAFERYVHEETAEVNALHVPKILRFMGFSLGFEEQQAYVTKVDLDQSGALGIFELRKLIRMCREQREQQVLNAFYEYDEDEDGYLDQEDTIEALRSLGLVWENKPRLSTKLTSIHMVPGTPLQTDLRTFMKLAAKRFSHLQQEARDQGGWSKKELVQLRARFDGFDEDGSGDVSNSELVGLVKSVFPEMASDHILRPQLLEIIKEADADGSGSLDFEDFIRLMRSVHDLKYSTMMEKERKAVKETHFSPPEVHDFRELYMEKACQHTSKLSLAEFREMVARVCPMGERNSTSLTNLWCEVATRFTKHDIEEDDEGQDAASIKQRQIHREVDFPEFMVLMRRILDTNWGDVIQRTTGAGAEAKTDDQDKAEDAAPKPVKILDTAVQHLRQT